ncbi:(E-E)-geranyllinalool synthase [Striga hermonthica]|uniref:(E-E)-geranyllinalool synthase n=1 Tax=Striga hermonthica TaxID=68872 RepID=A0A9N7MY75_STRHE|nr:(E-E)-geranyllinalool synthase [Striga hermonthica]
MINLNSIKSLVSEVKEEILCSGDYDNVVHEFVSHCSAYDTAWLAMIPDRENGNGPMFKSCLDWIVENQNEGGFWGGIEQDDNLLMISIDALPATLASLVALKKWNASQHHSSIEKGLGFIHSKVDAILSNNYQNLPHEFILSFPAMIELSIEAGLDLLLSPRARDIVTNIFINRQHILEMEELEVNKSSYYNSPLLAHLETLPSKYYLDRLEIVEQYLRHDGSLFQSPSATARAFMITGNLDCMIYLESLVRNFPNGVPSKYPMDGDLVKLCIVDHLQGLGLAEHFGEDIQKILAQVYSNQKDYNNLDSTEINMVQKLFKDALAFRLLRMQGYSVTPGSFCWFLHEPEIMARIEHNSERFTCAMYNVYRATDLQFPREAEMEEARIIARKLLENISTTNPSLYCSKGLQNMIKYELNVPWTARLNHIYHRKWIEENRTSPLCFGTPPFYRLSGSKNNKLLQLAVENYELRQMIYRRELEELKGWSKKWRLSEMGFGREKSVYTYFVMATSSCFPFNSIMRLVAAKAAIIVTVADDFYDMEGSLTELETLTDAIRRWDSRGLEGHGKTIFEALDDFVNEIASCSCGPQERTEFVTKLRHLWIETFDSWMVERRWSLTGYKPSMDEYLLTGMISIAAHTIALPTTDFLTRNSTNGPNQEYHGITKLLMSLSRLANDTQSYEKEKLDGKLNYVLLHSDKNPSMVVADSVAYVRGIIQDIRKEFVEHVYMDRDVNESFRNIHLWSMKIFHLFFESANLFDSETALVDEIQRALFVPIVQKPRPEPLLSPPVPLTPLKNVKNVREILARLRPVTRGLGNIGFIRPSFVKNSSTSYVGRERTNAIVPIQFSLCFM